jgi:hypothetical protein
VRRVYVQDGGLVVRARRISVADGAALRRAFDLALPSPSPRESPVVNSSGVTLRWSNGAFPEGDVAALFAQHGSELVLGDSSEPGSAERTYFVNGEFTVNAHTRSVQIYYSFDAATWFPVDGYDVAPGGTYLFRAPGGSTRPTVHLRVTTYAGSGFGGVQGFTGYFKV